LKQNLIGSLLEGNTDGFGRNIKEEVGWGSNNMLSGGGKSSGNKSRWLEGNGGNLAGRSNCFLRPGQLDGSTTLNKKGRPA